MHALCLKPEISLTGTISTTDRLVCLVDPPGMGKTSVTTKLEEQLRRSVSKSRIIIRINLNSIEDVLFNQPIQRQLEITKFISSCVPYIPLVEIQKQQNSPKLKFILLLDGFDEVCPRYEQTTLHILKSLCENKCHEDKLEIRSQFKVFLTTRPHLRKLVEDNFSVKIVSLCPLNVDEQAWFVSKEVRGFSELDGRAVLERLPASLRTIMENPLMLHLFCQVAKELLKSGDLESIKLYQLYERFIQEKHVVHVIKTLPNVNPQSQHGERLVKNMLKNNLQYYYCIALQDLGTCWAWGWPTFGKAPEGEDLEELLSYGVLLADRASNRPRFLHKSLAEFFYARLLINPETCVELRSNLFKQIYLWGSLENVEEFLLSSLQERSPGESNKTLVLSESWVYPNNNPGNVFGNFLNGKLFPILGTSILPTSVDINDEAIVKELRKFSYNTTSLRFLQWLNGRDKSWFQQKFLLITGKESMNLEQAHITVNLLYADPEGLGRSLAEHEILSALLVCDNLFQVEAIDTELWPKWMETVKLKLNQSEIKNAMVRHKVLE